MRKNIILCGVGGQGTVLASKLISESAMARGIPVMSAETIGMAQKGGSVTSFIRLGEELFTPMIPKKEADLLIAFEPAEAVRMLPWLKEGGSVIVNSCPVKPVTSMLSGNPYNGEEMLDYLRVNIQKLIVVDCGAACAEIGSPKVVNMVLLGAALETGELPVTMENIVSALEKRVAGKFMPLNQEALHYVRKHGGEKA